ncbi:MAG: hypothetical protein ABI543_09535 [Ignavibacteria bacterium]
MNKLLKPTSPTSSKEGLVYKKPGYVTANPLSYNVTKEIRENLKKNPTKTELMNDEVILNPGLIALKIKRILDEHRIIISTSLEGLWEVI